MDCHVGASTTKGSAVTSTKPVDTRTHLEILLNIGNNKAERVGGFRNLQSRNQAKLTTKGLTEATEKVATAVSEPGELSEVEISKMISFLKPFIPILAV